MAATRSRRHALKLFGVTALGGFASLAGAGKASAFPGRCFQSGHGCRESTECCSNFCDPSTAQCACSPGSFTCASSGLCVTCGPGQVFNATTCSCVCPSGTKACGSNCCAPQPAQVCVSGACCTNPVTCTSDGQCCPGWQCTGGGGLPGHCQLCLNPT